MRKLALIITALALLCLSGAALAQDTPMQTFCGDLSAVDCQILTQAQTAMPSLDSATFDFNVNMLLSNLPDMPKSGAITIDGSGSYSGVAGLRDSAMSMSSMSMMSADYGALLQNVLDSFDGSLTLTVTIPQELMNEADPSAPNSLTLDLRLIDGVGYINFDALQPLLNDPSLTGWGGLDLANFLRDAVAQNPDLLDMSGMMEMSGMNGMNPMDYAHEFQDPAFMGQFVTIQRTDDGTGDTATFVSTVDLAALMSTQEFQDMMTQQMQAQDSTSGMDTKQMMSLMQQMYQGMSITVTQVIGTSDYYTHSISGTFDFDMTSMMDAMGSMSGDMAATPTAMMTAAPMVNVTFSINYDDFNSAPALTVPKNVSMLPYQMFLSALAPQPTIAAPMMTVAAPTAEMMTMEPTAEMTMESTMESTAEMTMEPTAEMTMEPTAEMTVEPPIVVTMEPTAEVTVSP